MNIKPPHKKQNKNRIQEWNKKVVASIASAAKADMVNEHILIMPTQKVYLIISQLFQLVYL